MFLPTKSHKNLRLPLSLLSIADTLLDILTVDEMLMYTAELKRPLEQSLKEASGAQVHTCGFCLSWGISSGLLWIEVCLLVMSGRWAYRRRSRSMSAYFLVHL